MKKLLLALLIVLTLSGCERTSEFTENYQGATDGYTLDNLEYEYLQSLMNCDENDTNEPECEYVGYYTQEEVDELLQEIYDAFENIESNDGYIERTYVNHNELDLYIQELETRIDELESAIGLVAWETLNVTNIMYGEFVGINAYGDCSQFCRTYAVVEVDGVEYEVNPTPDYTYTMGERIMIFEVNNGTYYSLPFGSSDTE